MRHRTQIKSNQPFQFIINFKQSTPLCATATTWFRGFIFFFNRAQPFQTSTRRVPIGSPADRQRQVHSSSGWDAASAERVAAAPRGFGVSTPFLTRRGSLGRAKVGRVTCTCSRVSRYVWRETGLVGLKVIVESQLAKCQTLLSARATG